MSERSDQCSKCGHYFKIGTYLEGKPCECKPTVPWKGIKMSKAWPKCTHEDAGFVCTICNPPKPAPSDGEAFKFVKHSNGKTYAQRVMDPEPTAREFYLFEPHKTYSTMPPQNGKHGNDPAFLAQFIRVIEYSAFERLNSDWVKRNKLDRESDGELIAVLKADNERLQRERDELREQVEHVFCAYCSFQTRVPTPTKTLLEHIEVCEFHPIPKLRKERDKLQAALLEADKIVYRECTKVTQLQAALEAKEAECKVQQECYDHAVEKYTHVCRELKIAKNNIDDLEQRKIPLDYKEALDQARQELAHTQKVLKENLINYNAACVSLSAARAELAQVKGELEVIKTLRGREEQVDPSHTEARLRECLVRITKCKYHGDANEIAREALAEHGKVGG